MSNTINISTQECLTQRQLQQYCMQQLQGNTLHSVEEHLTTCDMCSDAVEGFMLAPNTSLNAIAELVNPFEQEERKNPFIGFINNKVWLAASGLLLLFGISYAVYNNAQQHNNIAANTKKTIANTDFMKQNEQNEIPKDNNNTETIASEGKTADVQKNIIENKTDIAGNPDASINNKEKSVGGINTPAMINSNTRVASKVGKAVANNRDVSKAANSLPSTTTDDENNKEQAQVPVIGAPPTQAPNYTPNTNRQVTEKDLQNQPGYKLEGLENTADNNITQLDNYRSNETKTNLRKPKENKSLPTAAQNNNNSYNNYSQEKAVTQQTKKANAPTSNGKAQELSVAKVANTQFKANNYAAALQQFLKLSEAYKNENPDVYLSLAKCYYATLQNNLAESNLAAYAKATNTNAKKMNRIREKMVR